MTRLHVARGAEARVDLGGGACLVTEPDHSIPLVSISLCFRVGMDTEAAELEGISRFAARMLRRGADGLGSSAIEMAFDRLGAELSTDVSTSVTTVSLQVIRRSLEPALALLTRLLVRPDFPEAELEKLKRETVADLSEALDDDRTLCQRAFRRALFGDHAYGRGAVGRATTVARFEARVARARYESIARAGQLVVGMSGDVTASEAERLTRALVAALPGGASTDPHAGEPPRRPGRHLVLVDKPDRTQTQVLIGTLGTSPHDEDHVALGAGVAVLGGTFTSRLTREVRSKRGWSYGASARASADRQRHAFTMWTFPAADDCAPCIALELRLLEAWVASGISARELSFIKRYLTRSHAFEVDTANKRLHRALDVDLLDLPRDYHTGFLDRVAGLSRDDVGEAIARRIAPADLVVVVVGTAAGIRADVEKAIGGLESTVVVPFDQD